MGTLPCRRCNVLKNLGTSPYKQSRIGALMIYAIGDVKAWLHDSLFFFFFLFSVQQFGREWVYLTYAFVFSWVHQCGGLKRSSCV